MAGRFALVAVLAGCSAANDIDVCDRAGLAEHEINRRTEGEQAVQSPSAVGAMPFGGSLVVFASEVSATDPDRTEIRGTLVAADGTPLRTCDRDEEQTFAPADPTGPAQQLRLGPAVAPPWTDDAAGLVTYMAQEADGTWEVHGRFVSGTGCPYQDLDPFVISVDGPEHEPNVPAVLGLGPEEFLVVWPSVPTADGSLDGRLRARVVRADPLGPQFQPTTPSPAGEPVELTAGGSLVIWAALTRTRDGEAMVIWQVDETTGPVIWAEVLSDRLDEIVAPFQIGEGREGLPMGAGVGVAFDGAQVLAVWVARDAADTPRVWGRYLTPGGDFLSAPQAPHGEPFLVGEGGVGSEGRPTVTPLAAGGFLVAWEQVGEGGPSTSSLRAMAFDAEGGPQFNDRACDRVPFTLARGDDGAQRHPALALLSDGTVAAAWTDGGFNGPDRSGGSIRGLSLRPRDLLPIE